MKNELIEKAQFLGYEKSIHLDKYLHLCEIKKWLREVHKIHISVITYHKNNVLSGYIVIVFKVLDNPIYERIEISDTYELALEKGLQEALSSIKP